MRSTMKVRLALCIMFLTLSACGDANKKAEEGNQQDKKAVVIAPASQADQELIKKKFAEQSKGKLKAEEVLDVSSTPLAGIYQVFLTKDEVYYVDKDVNYIIAGQLLDLNNERNLTAEAAKQFNKIDYKALPLDKAIKDVKGKGKLQVVVFSDPDCPYCKKLEDNFAKIDDLTVYTLLNPIKELHPDAEQKSKQIWCSPNKAKAWTDWVRNNVAPTASADCDTPIAEIQALSRKLGFNGTPVMVFPNGVVVSGLAAEGDELKKLIEANQQ